MIFLFLAVVVLVIDVLYIRAAFKYVFGIKGKWRYIFASSLVFSLSSLLIITKNSCSAVLSVGPCGTVAGWPLSFFKLQPIQTNYVIDLLTAKLKITGFDFLFFILNIASWIIIFSFLKILFEIYQRLYDRIFYRKYPLK